MSFALVATKMCNFNFLIKILLLFSISLNWPITRCTGSNGKRILISSLWVKWKPSQNKLVPLICRWSVLYYATLQINLQSNDVISKTPQHLCVASYEEPPMSQIKQWDRQMYVTPPTQRNKDERMIKMVKKLVGFIRQISVFSWPTSSNFVI